MPLFSSAYIRGRYCCREAKPVLLFLCLRTDRLSASPLEGARPSLEASGRPSLMTVTAHGGYLTIHELMEIPVTVV